MPAPSEKVVICVLSNVTKSLIDQFIVEYKQELVEAIKESDYDIRDQRRSHLG